MNTYVALLRGINVGGRNSLPMRELTDILENIGCRNIRTYIQSGNVVLRTDKNPGSLGRGIGAEVRKRCGFEPHVLILSEHQFTEAIDRNPFGFQEPDSEALHLGFLNSIPSAPDLDGLEASRSPTEKFSLVGQVFYLLAPDGVGRSKLAAKSERLLGTAMTVRNWKTIIKIMAMLKALRE